MAYNNRTTVSSMLNVANVSGLFEQERCLRKVPPFSHQRYFHLYRTASSNHPFPTGCKLRPSVDDEWKDLMEDGSGFISFAPSLDKTPPTLISCPDGVSEVNKRFHSEEGRINCSEKLQELYQLRDRVFNSRSQKFHWSADCFENAGKVETETYQTDIGIEIDIEQESSPVLNDYDYSLNNYVAVITGDQSCPFWIGTITKVHKNKSSVISRLTLHWHELQGASVYDGIYKEAYLQGKGKRSPWIGIVSSDSVVLTFQRLTTRKRLPANVHKKLRTEFGAISS